MKIVVKALPPQNENRGYGPEVSVEVLAHAIERLSFQGLEMMYVVLFGVLANLRHFVSTIFCVPPVKIVCFILGLFTADSGVC